MMIEYVILFGKAVAIGALLFVGLYGVLRGAGGRLPVSADAPIRVREAMLLLAVGGGAAQVFAAASWEVGMLALLLLLGLAAAGLRLYYRLVPAALPAPAPARPLPEPVLLLYCGRVLPDSLAGVSLSEAKLRALLLAHGLTDLQQLQAVVWEANGNVTVMTMPSGRKPQPGYTIHAN